MNSLFENSLYCPCSREKECSFIQYVSLLKIVFIQDENSKLYAFYQNGELDYFTGESDVLGNFTVNIDTTVDLASRSFLALKTNEIPDAATVEVKIQVLISIFTRCGMHNAKHVFDTFLLCKSVEILYCIFSF